MAQDVPCPTVYIRFLRQCAEQRNYGLQREPGAKIEKRSFVTICKGTVDELVPKD